MLNHESENFNAPLPEDMDSILLKQAISDSDKNILYEEFRKNELSLGEEHRNRHTALHKYLTELVADWIGHTGKLPCEGTILELVKWSSQQRDNPDETNE